MNDPNENEEVTQGSKETVPEETVPEETVPEISYEDRVTSGLISLGEEEEEEEEE